MVTCIVDIDVECLHVKRNLSMTCSGSHLYCCYRLVDVESCADSLVLWIQNKCMHIGTRERISIDHCIGSMHLLIYFLLVNVALVILVLLEAK
jgi:hypothetical protein